MGGFFVCGLFVGFFFLIFCSKNGEFTSRNSFCLETDHLKDAHSREQCAGKLSTANLGVENRGKSRTLRLFSAFPSLSGVLWHSPVEKLLFTFTQTEAQEPVGEVEAHVQA